VRQGRAGRGRKGMEGEGNLAPMVISTAELSAYGEGKLNTEAYLLFDSSLM